MRRTVTQAYVHFQTICLFNLLWMQAFDANVLNNYVTADCERFSSGPSGSSGVAHLRREARPCNLEPTLRGSYFDAGSLG